MPGTATTIQYGPFTLAMNDGIIHLLTPCCSASAKGVTGGIVCRNCYHPVPSAYGMGAAATDHAALLDMLLYLQDTQPARIRAAMHPDTAIAALGA